MHIFPFLDTFLYWKLSDNKKKKGKRNRQNGFHLFAKEKSYIFLERTCAPSSTIKDCVTYLIIDLEKNGIAEIAFWGIFLDSCKWEKSKECIERSLTPADAIGIYYKGNPDHQMKCKLD